MATITSQTAAGDFISRREHSGAAEQTAKRGLIRWLPRQDHKNQFWLYFN